MKSLYNFFEVWISTFFEKIQSLNKKIFWWVILVYGVFAIHKYFPVIYTLYTFENFTILVFLQIAIFSVGKVDFLRKLLSEYFQYLAFTLQNILIALLGITLFGLLFLSGEDVTLLVRPAVISFGLVVYLSIYYRKSSFEFFKKFIVSKRSSIVVTLGASIFVIFYAYKFIFANSGVLYPILLSSFVGLIFLLSILFAGSDLPTRIHNRYFHLLPSERVLIRKKIKYISSTAIALIIIVISLLSWINWEQIKTKILSFQTPDILATSKLPVDSNTTLPEENATPDPLLPDESLETDILLEDAGNSVSVPSKLGDNPTTFDNSLETKTIGDIFLSKRYIGIGDTGDDIIWIQNYLKKVGYYTGIPTKIFDTPTSEALNRFMQAKTGTSQSFKLLGPKNMVIFKKIKAE